MKVREISLLALLAACLAGAAAAGTSAALAPVPRNEDAVHAAASEDPGPSLRAADTAPGTGDVSGAEGSGRREGQDAASGQGGAADGERPRRSLNMRFALVPAGSFVMGSDAGRPFSFRDEHPPHQVTISRPFYLGVLEVTQEQWGRVMGFNPSGTVLPGGPVESVSAAEALEFVEAFNRFEETARYRLPTEAEWEYAARGGSDTDYFFGQGPEQVGEYAWHKGNSDGKLHPAGLLRPNPLGLHDIIGNVYEWTADSYGEYYYEVSPILDPQGPAGSGELRSVRGCAFDAEYFNCRSADRGSLSSDEKRPNQGFRIAYTGGQ
ncbi:MAG: formylglycine-generating enzyme family protein [Deltaproteobacteria bacterium]|jgi:formylglycine-generating enzyme required for sulfatase activity|nr:formylglycine-generating enzyme family protein [Deltaproteobacteria bacterium]